LLLMLVSFQWAVLQEIHEITLWWYHYKGTKSVSKFWSLIICSSNVVNYIIAWP
jgi:hypothetical protein